LSGKVVKVLPYGGNMYVLVAGNTAADNEAYWINTSTNQLTPVTGTAVLPTISATFDAIVYSGDLIVSFQGSNLWRITSTSTGASFAQQAGKLAVFDGILWGSRNAASNMLAQYSQADETLIAPTNIGAVGSSAYPIRGMVAGFDGALWVGKDDGLYSVRPDGAGGYVIELVVDLLPVVSSNNGKAMIVFGGNLYMSVSNTIMRYDGSTIQFMGPDKGAHATEKFFDLNTNFNSPSAPQPVNLLPPTYQAGIVGGITHMFHDATFLYAVASNKGLAPDRIYVWGGTGWHLLVEGWDPPATLNGGWFTGEFATSGLLSYPVYWFSLTEGGDDTFHYIKWSRHSVNPLDDLTLEYEATGWIITPWYDAGLFDLEKVFFNFVVNALGLVAGSEDIDVEFQVDDYDVWYTLGTVSTTPEGVLKFPDNTEFDPALFAKKIRYRITLNRGATTTNTPVMKSWGHRFVVRPESRYGWGVSVKAYNNIQRLDRMTEEGQGLVIRDKLLAMRDSRVPIKYSDGRQLEPLTNRLTNPSFEVDTDGNGTADGWTFAPFTGTRSLNAQYKVSGIFSQRVENPDTGYTGLIQTVNTDVPGGATLFASAYVYIESGDHVRLEVVRAIDSTVVGTYIYNKPIEGVNSQRFERGTILLEDVDEGEYYIEIVRHEDDATQETVFYVDACELIWSTSWLKRENEVYIDGDQLRCHWNGTPHASTSTRQYGYFVYITAMTDTERYSENTAHEGLDYNGDITLEMRETI